MDDGAVTLGACFDMDPEGNYVDATFGRPINYITATEVKEAWLALESALKKCGISCALDVKHTAISSLYHQEMYFLLFTTTKTTDPNDIRNSRYLVHLLGMGVPLHQALKVMRGMPCDIIHTGYRPYGLAKTHGIKEDEYEERWKLVTSLPIQKVEELTRCKVYVQPLLDMVAAMGSSKVGVKMVRMTVEYIIVDNVPPGDVIKSLSDRIEKFKAKMCAEVVKGVGEMSLE